MTQCEEILEALESGKKLTPLDAWSDFGCSKLSTRIGELKQLGHKILGEMTPTYSEQFGEKTVMKYWIEQPEQGVLI